MSPLHQRTTDSLQSAPLSLKPGSTLVDNLWTLMDNWWTGDGCHPFLISFLFLQYVNVNLNFIDGQYARGKATTIFHDNELLEEHFAMAHLPCIEHWGWLSILSLPVPGALIAIPTNYWPSTSYAFSVHTGRRGSIGLYMAHIELCLHTDPQKWYQSQAIPAFFSKMKGTCSNHLVATW